MIGGGLIIDFATLRSRRDPYLQEGKVYLMNATRDEANRLEEGMWREWYREQRAAAPWIDLGGES